MNDTRWRERVTAMLDDWNKRAAFLNGATLEGHIATFAAEVAREERERCAGAVETLCEFIAAAMRSDGPAATRGEGT